METNIEIVPSVAEDIFELENKLRTEDVQECQAAGLTPRQALLDGYVLSDKCYTAKVKGKPEAMFGITTYQQPEGFGVIWYLGSNETFKYGLTMTKGSKKYVAQWLQEYKILYNCVYEENISHILWLKRLGFKFLNESTTVNGHKFLNFYKRNNKEQ